MNERNLSTLSDAEVMEQVRELARERRQVAEEVLLHFREVKRRGLRVPASLSRDIDELACETREGDE